MNATLSEVRGRVSLNEPKTKAARRQVALPRFLCDRLAREHPKVIQSRLGHASIKTTLDTYGHLFEGLDEAAAQRLDDLALERIAHETRTEGDGEVFHLDP